MRTVALSVVLLAVAAFAQEGGTIVLKAGEQKVITVPGLQRVAIGDSAVADVKTIGNNQLLLIGGGVGKTTLLVWKPSGDRISYLITVLDGEHELVVRGATSKLLVKVVP